MNLMLCTSYTAYWLFSSSFAIVHVSSFFPKPSLSYPASLRGTPLSRRKKRKHKLQPLRKYSPYELEHHRIILRNDQTVDNNVQDEGFIHNGTQSLSTNEIKSVPHASIEAPDTRRILSIAIPAIGIWLCGPLLSLIDTSTVGLLSGTAQQAALNPAVAVTDYSARLMSFLYTGSTNLVARSQESDGGVDGMPKTKTTVVGALQLAVLVGAGLGAFLLLFSRQLLRGLIGNDAIDPNVFDAARRYVCIRALGMPASAMIGTAQAACLGLRDVRSPLYVVLVAALVNLALDLVLVRHPCKWIGGCSGAAWATILAQNFAAWLFVKWLCDRNGDGQAISTSSRLRKTITIVQRKIFHSGASTRLASINASRDELSTPSASKTKSFSTRGFLAGQFGFRRLPSIDVSRGFAPYVIPVTTTQVGRCSTYIAMGHVVSSSFGTISMAANQIITSIFYSLIPIADSLSLTAQTFLPGIAEKAPSQAKVDALRTTLLNFLKTAGLMGGALTGIVAMIPAAGKLFTSDPAVIGLVNSIVPILFAVFSLHGVFCASEGILLGQRDLAFLGRMYALYFLVVPAIMLQVKRAALAGSTRVSLLTVWQIFLCYQLVRISAWVGRVLWLQRKASQAADEAEPRSS